jgi:hypothetical protein
VGDQGLAQVRRSPAGDGNQFRAVTRELQVSEPFMKTTTSLL